MTQVWGVGRAEETRVHGVSTVTAAFQGSLKTFCLEPIPEGAAGLCVLSTLSARLMWDRG